MEKEIAKTKICPLMKKICVVETCMFWTTHKTNINIGFCRIPIEAETYQM